MNSAAATLPLEKKDKPFRSSEGASCSITIFPTPPYSATCPGVQSVRQEKTLVPPRPPTMHRFGINAVQRFSDWRYMQRTALHWRLLYLKYVSSRKIQGTQDSRQYFCLIKRFNQMISPCCSVAVHRRYPPLSTGRSSFVNVVHVSPSASWDANSMVYPARPMSHRWP